MMALTAPKDQPPAEKWLPLRDVDDGTGGLPRARSAYALRNGPSGEQWLDFAVPPAVVADSLGPKALTPPRTLAQGSAPSSALRKRDGIWTVKVPRFFCTITTGWTDEMVGRNPLITRSGAQTSRSTVGGLAIEESFRRFSNEPDLLVDSDGPRMHSWRRDGYYNVGGLTHTEDVMAHIASLPPDTSVTCIWCEF